MNRIIYPYQLGKIMDALGTQPLCANSWVVTGYDQSVEMTCPVVALLIAAGVPKEMIVKDKHKDVMPFLHKYGPVLWYEYELDLEQALYLINHLDRFAADLNHSRNLPSLSTTEQVHAFIHGLLAGLANAPANS